MKLLRAAALLLSILLLMSACTPGISNQTGTTGPETTAPETTVPDDTGSDLTVPDDTGSDLTVPDDTGSDVTGPDNTGSGTVSQKPMASVSMPITTEATSAADGTVIFKYTHQSMSLILPDPDVARAVIVDFLNRISATAGTADALRAQAQKDYAESFLWEAPYQCQITYSPMRMDHGVLSIYGSSFTYTGGGRPDASYLAANYDLVNGSVLYLPDIFITDAWAETVVPLVQDALFNIKDQYFLDDDYEKTVRDRFSGNLSKDEKWYFSKTGLCFYFAPYELAPYASGTVVAEIPYEKLTAVLNPAYFPAETEIANGSIHIQNFQDANTSKFTQISELMFDQQGKMLLLYTDSYVQDIRITVTNLSEGLLDTTVYAAYTLTPGDAIMLQLPVSSANRITLYYTTGGTVRALPIAVS